LAEQQSCLMLHRTRHLFIRQQTAVINAIRAHLAEFGVVAPVGRKGVEELLKVAADASHERVPEIARVCLAALGAQLRMLKAQILEFDRRIMAWHRSNAASRRLDAIPGVGPALATALVACVADPSAFRSGRDFSAWDAHWWIVLPGSATKEGRPDERPVPEFLFDTIQRYLEEYRPILARGNSKITALWLAMNGGAIRYSYVGELITSTTYSTLGVKVSPHLFRACGATTGAIHAGDNPHLASALLHHRHPTVAAENYNRATSFNAAKALAAVTRLYREASRSGKRPTGN
jgi:hypothetical protein